jgi:hypothetical protein
VHEQDFKQALLDSMADITTPSMNESVLLDTAKRAARRRRAVLASGASAIAVVALAAGVAFAAPGADRSGADVGAAVTSTEGETEQDQPGGTTGATVTAGPGYERGRDLLDELVDVVPEGYDSPRGLTAKTEDHPFAPLPRHQVVRIDNDSWNYDAWIPLVKAGEFGSMHIGVLTDTPLLTSTYEEPCALSMGMLDPMILVPEKTDRNTGESCTEVTVAGTQVGVATKPGKVSVTYRHPDDTWVTLTEELSAGYGYPSLTELPFTGEQLAELAADPRFHLD